MNLLKKGFLITLPLLAILFTSLSPLTMEASSLDISEATSTHLNKLIMVEDKVTADKLKNAYAEFLTLRQQELELDGQIESIHHTNEEALAALRKQIREIDAVSIASLQAEVTKTREQSKPLFALSESLNKQLSDAKKNKNKDLAAQIVRKLDGIKGPILLLRQEIRYKEALLKDAKDSANKTMKRIRTILDETNAIYTQIKIDKSVQSSIMKLFPLQTQYLNQTAKKGDATGALHALKTLCDYLSVIGSKQQNIYTLEQKITVIMENAKTQF